MIRKACEAFGSLFKQGELFRERWQLSDLVHDARLGIWDHLRGE